jgi:hypothetical protein
LPSLLNSCIPFIFNFISRSSWVCQS